MRMVSLLLTVAAVTAPLSLQAQEPADTREFRVDSESSWIRILAYPDGPLRRFGHHHVISHQGVSGTVEVAPNPLDSTVTLEIAVAGLTVDDPDMRALEGEDFEGEVPEKDIAGTRANMLGDRLLQGERFPLIRIRSTGMDGDMPDVRMTASVTVRGIENPVTFPVHVDLADDTFVATGQMDLTHAELGLAPFTAAGGALSVRDLLVLKYEITGRAVH